MTDLICSFSIHVLQSKYKHIWEKNSQNALCKPVHKSGSCCEKAFA